METAAPYRHLQEFTTSQILTPSALTVTATNGCISAPATDVLTINPIPKVNAGTDKIIQTGTSVLLNAAVTPSAGNYKYLWLPATGLNAANILQPTSSTTLTTTYLLQVEDINSHCKARDSVVVSVISKLFIANSFTPNGDGTNDTWKLPGMALYPDGVVTIFNRYGERIFESTNYAAHPWDGSYKGIQQPTGTFIYIIKLNDSKNQVLQGTVTIIR